MKNKINILGVALIALVCLGSCEKTYVEPVKTTTPIEDRSIIAEDESMAGPVATRIMITKGTWKISSFQWHDRENNGRFKDYFFHFGADGVLTAVHRNIREHGKWGKEQLSLMINFGDMTLLKLLNNKNWTINDHSSSFFSMKGISPYDSSTEFLVFERVSF